MSTHSAWHQELRIQIVSRDLPIEVIAIPEQAEYQIIASFTPDRDGVGGTGRLEVISAEDGRIVWWAQLRSNLGNSTAKLAKALKKWASHAGER